MTDAPSEAQWLHELFADGGLADLPPWARPVLTPPVDNADGRPAENAGESTVGGA